jgi:hypothetical protein
MKQVRLFVPCAPGIRACLAALVVWPCLAGPATAQSPPVNAALVGHWDGYSGTYADIWADGDYVYLPTFNPNGTAAAVVVIVDISNPANPVHDETFFVPAPNDQASPQEVMTGDGLLFIALEYAGSDSVSIVDIRDPGNRSELTTVHLNGFLGIHNVFYDNGYLYFCDSATPRVAVIDLTNFDPDNPPAGSITSAKWMLQDVGDSFVHEIAVLDGRLYAAAWDGGLWIYDVSRVATTAPVFLGSTPGNNVHSMWPTADGRFVVLGEERANGGIKVFEIFENAGALDLVQRDSLTLPSAAFSTHNQIVIGNRLYVSWYQAGLQVFDIDCDTGKLQFVASYDTHADANSGGFEGNWGVHPMLGDDKILASDMDNGLFIVDIAGPPLIFCYAQGRPQFVAPIGGTPLQVEITAGSGQPDPASAQLIYQIDGGPPQMSPMLAVGDLYTGQFGPVPCGSTVSYYVSIETLTSQEVTSPAGAPFEQFTASAAFGTVTASSFDFEITAGWTVSGTVPDASSGLWQAGTPVDSGTDGDPTIDFDGSGQCFLTGNAAGNTDVDGGATILTSPVLSLSGLAEPRLSYARWYSNVGGNSPEADIFTVEISQNGTAWLPLETVGPGGAEVQGGWFQVIQALPPPLAKASSVRLRFTASDTADPSVVEAAVDAVAVLDLVCEAGDCPGGTTAECADLNQDGVRDDPCIWWACASGSCVPTDVPFADMGGAFGNCPPDLIADGNDRFHALNCFANSTTLGAVGYPCEDMPPVAFNVDAVGSFGTCQPDGVCDGNDAFAALNAFEGTATCTCPAGGPEPRAGGPRKRHGRD